ncbi:class I SAM-dependent methyltransferase [bacterium]|jgi:ubiquinone/menaquinone biosynthesis C-methylase UbiE|nr:class I SAM-dependent methyltransferase [bacterium]
MLQTVSVIEIFSLFLSKIKPQTALEIGCGTGGILASLDIPSKIGIDTYIPDLEIAELKYPQIIPIKYDILKLKNLFLDRSFDLVFGFDILEHFKSEQIPQIIEMCEQFSRKATVFWLPMEKTISDNPYPENTGNVHRSLLTPALFSLREYEMIRFPHYWRNGRAETDIDGLFCFKKI